MSHRWRILFKPIHADAQKVSVLVQACCALHNYLCALDATYNPAGYADVIQANGHVRPGQWRAQEEGSGFVQIRAPGRNHTREASAIRNQFVDYLSSEAGAVGWQDEIINRR